MVTTDNDDWNVTMQMAAFLAGYQMGRIEEGLRVAEDTAATTARFLRVNRRLVPQVEANGRLHGYQLADVRVHAGEPYAPLVDITLRRISDGDTDGSA